MKKTAYEILRQDTVLASIDLLHGGVTIYKELPVGLSFSTETSPMDIVENILKFYDWCASRTLMMSQKHAKKICNALALSQEITTKNKAMIALSYHCSTLNDGFWVREQGAPLCYAEVSLFRNTSQNILTEVSLKGNTSSVFRNKLKNWSDIGTDGTLAKSWVREGNEYFLYKACDNIPGEVLAGRVLEMLQIPHVDYEGTTFDGIPVTKCKCFTSEEYGAVPFRTLITHDNKALQDLKQKFPTQYANFVVANYIIGNEDLHDKNWGVRIDNRTGEIVGLSPCYDFDSCFLYYSSSWKNFFLPECIFTNNETGVTGPTLDPDVGDFCICGPTFEEAALQYISMSSIDFSLLNFNEIPEQFHQELKRRIDLLEMERTKNSERELNPK